MTDAAATAFLTLELRADPPISPVAGLFPLQASFCPMATFPALTLPVHTLVALLEMQISNGPDTLEAPSVLNSMSMSSSEYAQDELRKTRRGS